MRISYAILTHNEGEYIDQLLSFLKKYKRPEDEIVIVDDNSTDELTLSILSNWFRTGLIKLYKHELNNDFSAQKNYLNSKCTGDYIFQIDADELPSEFVIENIHSIIKSNPVDVFLVPRINIVDGLTEEHIQKWNWSVNANGYINFPDFQFRIYKNHPDIRWFRKVHERLDGYSTYGFLPEDKEYCLIHHKQIDRQEKQNEYYNKI